MKKNWKNIVYLAILFVVAALFYTSAWSDVEMSASRKLFICGVVGCIHGGLSCAVIGTWEK